MQHAGPWLVGADSGSLGWPAWLRIVVVVGAVAGIAAAYLADKWARRHWYGKVRATFWIGRLAYLVILLACAGLIITAVGNGSKSSGGG
jgi:hypothetical protein